MRRVGRLEVSGELASAAVEWLLMARFQLLKRVEKRKKPPTTLPFYFWQVNPAALLSVVPLVGHDANAYLINQKSL